MVKANEVISLAMYSDELRDLRSFVVVWSNYGLTRSNYGLTLRGPGNNFSRIYVIFARII